MMKVSNNIVEIIGDNCFININNLVNKKWGEYLSTNLFEV
jgi:hypothetical protein